MQKKYEKFLKIKQRKYYEYYQKMTNYRIKIVLGIAYLEKYHLRSSIRYIENMKITKR
jgi:hypothetical protein